jgi:hypothetical protein
MEEMTNIALRFSARKEGLHSAVGGYVSAQISVVRDHGKSTAKPTWLVCIDPSVDNLQVLSRTSPCRSLLGQQMTT